MSNSEKQGGNGPIDQHARLREFANTQHLSYVLATSDQTLMPQSYEKDIEAVSSVGTRQSASSKAMIGIKFDKSLSGTQHPASLYQKFIKSQPPRRNSAGS